jgi:hypothetical protein
MIRSKIFILLLLAIAIGTLRAAESKLGKEITLKEKTSISNILANPEKFEGKTVLVEGKILDVCQSMGCWIEIAGNNDKEKIKIKVEDGEIVFPKESKGKTALVQGVVALVKGGEACQTEHAENKESHKHESHETKHVDKKESHTGESCCSKNTKAKVYQIEGIGAVIK